jgi:hypothetical protein
MNISAAEPKSVSLALCVPGVYLRLDNNYERAGDMIRHVVFFKFKPESSRDERREALDQLRALPDKIEVIRSFEVGEDLLGSRRSWDAALIATYDDLTGLEIYQRHDDHVSVALKLQQLCDAIGSVDYEF